MSKDKGNKNHKKPKADKTGKKVMSDYKAESKGKKDQSTLEVFTPKSDDKTGGGHKKK